MDLKPSSGCGRRALFGLSAVVSLQRSGFDALPFQNVDCGEVFPVIRNLGFQAVELAIRDPFFANCVQIESALGKAGLRLSAVGTGQAYVDEHLSLLRRDGDAYQRTVERLKDHIALAALFSGCRVIIGCIRGKFADWGQDREGGIAQFRRAVSELAEIAHARNVDLLVEPINRYETGLINSLEECMEHIERIGAPNIKVLADTFHMNIEERDFAQALRMCGTRLGHVHLADSNRATPGTGHFPFPVLLRVLKEMNYQGDLAFEIVPGQDPLRALAEGIAYITAIGAEVTT